MTARFYGENTHGFFGGFSMIFLGDVGWHSPRWKGDKKTSLSNPKKLKRGWGKKTQNTEIFFWKKKCGKTTSSSKTPPLKQSCHYSVTTWLSLLAFWREQTRRSVQLGLHRPVGRSHASCESTGPPSSRGPHGRWLRHSPWWLEKLLEPKKNAPCEHARFWWHELKPRILGNPKWWGNRLAEKVQLLMKLLKPSTEGSL